jgi:glycosyltransferase involved in cell wall biosynthesis
LAADAEALSPRRTAVVANGLSSPKALPGVPDRVQTERTEILFLGQCSRTKGLFDAVQAVTALEKQYPGYFHLTVAGDFPSSEEKAAFLLAMAQVPKAVRYVGPVDEPNKRALFAASDVFCFPSYYPHEGQPLVLIEALAHDVPIVATRWRAIPSMLPPEFVSLVDPQRPDQLADAIVAARAAGLPYGVLRSHYESRFTLEAHLKAMHGALERIEKKRY